MKVYARQELDTLRCGTPGCDCAGPLVLTPRCHQSAATLASYDWTTGLLTVVCARCRKFVGAFAIAAEPPAPAAAHRDLKEEGT